MLNFETPLTLDIGLHNIMSELFVPGTNLVQCIILTIRIEMFNSFFDNLLFFAYSVNHILIPVKILDNPSILVLEILLLFEIVDHTFWLLLKILSIPLELLMVDDFQIFSLVEKVVEFRFGELDLGRFVNRLECGIFCGHEMKFGYLRFKISDLTNFSF